MAPSFRQAERCRRLARDCTDLALRETLPMPTNTPRASGPKGISGGGYLGK
jgi:hypothetical protein